MTRHLTTRADDSHATPVVGPPLRDSPNVSAGYNTYRFRTCQAQDKVLRVASN